MNHTKFKYNSSSLFPPAVRLVNSSNLLSSGRVEVLHNGTWGTICDNSWDLQDADVVCRQLGYDGALSAPGGAAFGQGTGQIWLVDVKCIGNETLIALCSHGGWGVHNCGHHEDVGVVCRHLKGKFNFDLACYYFETTCFLCSNLFKALVSDR